jgi:hypothetical protein
VIFILHLYCASLLCYVTRLWLSVCCWDGELIVNLRDLLLLSFEPQVASAPGVLCLQGERAHFELRAGKRGGCFQSLFTKAVCE